VIAIIASTRRWIWLGEVTQAQGVFGSWFGGAIAMGIAFGRCAIECWRMNCQHP